MINNTPEKINEIGNAKVTARWFMPHPGEAGPRVTLDLPHRCYLAGSSFVNTGADRFAQVGTLRVKHPELRGNGIGERLTRGLGALAYKYRYPTLRSDVVSQYSLDIFGRVFGKERISFEEFHGDGWESTYPQGFEETFTRLRELEAVEAILEARSNGVDVVVDLKGLDMRSWEPPVETAAPEFDWALLEAAS